MLRKFMAVLRKPRKNIVVFQIGKPMKQAELEDVAGSISTEEPWWRLLMQLAQEEMAACNVRALDPKISDAETKWHLGGEEAIGAVVDRLHALVRQSRAKAR